MSESEEETRAERHEQNKILFGEYLVKIKRNRPLPIPLPGDSKTALAMLYEKRRSERNRSRGLRDSVTGLYSRNFFDTQLPIELSLARRSKIPMGLALGDMRGLKKINDRYGRHSMGDQFLRITAGAIKQAGLRIEDSVCRTGGDEIGILFPQLKPTRDENGIHTAMDGLARATIRSLRAVTNQKISISDGSEKSPYVDFGITIARPDDTPQSLYDRADGASYLAKKMFSEGEQAVVAVLVDSDMNDLYFRAELKDDSVVYTPINNAAELLELRPPQ